MLIESNDSIKTIKLDRNLTIENMDQKKGCCGGGKKEIINDLRIIFLGCNGVGKTNIIQAIKGKKINNKYEPTKCINKFNYTYTSKKKERINVKIYDANGDFINDDDDVKILKKMKIFFLVFDINKKKTFDELENYIKQIKKFYSAENMHISIIGNKINKNEGNDNEDEVISDEEAKNFANKYKANYQTIFISDVKNLRNIINDEINTYLNDNYYDD